MRLRWFDMAMNAALMVGEWLMIRYIYDHRPKALAKRGLDEAIRHGNLEMVK